MRCSWRRLTRVVAAAIFAVALVGPRSVGAVLTTPPSAEDLPVKLALFAVLLCEVMAFWYAFRAVYHGASERTRNKNRSACEHSKESPVT
jgi:hypothetical protein